MVNQRVRSNIVFLVLIINTLLFFLKCDDKQQYLPYVNVSYSISKVQLNHVGTLGHYIVENEGLNGIILFRNAEDIWQAFEKTCTYNPDDHLCEVDIEDGSFFSVCPCCDSEFNLVNDGIPQVGPAELPMKQYQVREDNSRVYISN